MPGGGSSIDAKTFNVGNAGRDFSTPDFDPSAEAAAKEGAKQFGVWQVCLTQCIGEMVLER